MDALSMLEDWLDGREPPDAPPAHDIDPVSRRTFRSVPACRYPAFARHDGNGDPNDAAGFTCAARPDPIGFRPD